MGRQRSRETNQTAEIINAYWLSLRIIRLIVENDDMEELRKYSRKVLRPNSGVVHRLYDQSMKRGRKGGKMEMSDHIQDIFDLVVNNLLPEVIGEEYVAEIRAEFADGLAAAEEPTRYVSLCDLDDDYEV